MAKITGPISVLLGLCGISPFSPYVKDAFSQSNVVILRNAKVIITPLEIHARNLEDSWFRQGRAKQTHRSLEA